MMKLHDRQPWEFEMLIYINFIAGYSIIKDVIGYNLAAQKVNSKCFKAYLL